eukprot:GFUD01021424.1.p1 GENE.GFUD01021424.1~~GFUD01021424.1.p1  ORF type:complete len:125 (-),score=10.22 GFUD01021424.1:14-388(-)
MHILQGSNTLVSPPHFLSNQYLENTEMDERRPLLSSWLNFGNRKTRKHIGIPERANFDFRSNSGEVPSSCASSRSSYSSCSSSTRSSYSSNSQNNTSPRISSTISLEKVFLYLLPFIILFVFLV